MYMMPSMLYANITEEASYEAALYRTYNRYMGRQCQAHADRLRWAGLLPLRDIRQGCETIGEMQKLGAAAAVVYGTVGKRMRSHSRFAPVWDECARSGLTLDVHTGTG